MVDQEMLDTLRSNELSARAFGVLDYAAACQEYVYQYETYGRLPVDERGRIYGRSNELGHEIRIGLGEPVPNLGPSDPSPIRDTCTSARDRDR